LTNIRAYNRHPVDTALPVISSGYRGLVYMSRQQLIESRLREAFPLQHLDVQNESHMHSAGQDTHFKLVVVSAAFAGLRPVARHQKIYALLQDEMSRGLHALALHLYTPEEWAAVVATPASPACLGGSKHG
jgi:BolA protein